MSTTRREFLQTAAAAASTLGLGAAATRRAAAQDAAQPAPAAKTDSGTLDILILGGTRFLGPALVESAIARGHTVTLFNRGRSNPEMFPDLEKLIGNRDPDLDGGLEALKGRTWDAVVDTSGYVPRHVRASAQLLAEAVKQYVFVSTISVYADPGVVGINEDSPVGTLKDESVEEVTNETYGPLKALCELAVEAALPGHATNIRPGLIVGPRDPTDRFTYWPVRIARGGEVLAPGSGDDQVQIIDVRDLADFCIHCIEHDVTGTYNAVGPACPMLMDEMLHGCKAVTGGCVGFTWVPADFLAEEGISEWTDMPVWVRADGDSAGFSDVSNGRGIAEGLTFRPFADTARATLEWFRTLPEDRQKNLRWGIKPERETETLAAWHAAHDSKTP